MEYRRLGSSGLQVSAVGLGTNNFGTRMEEKPSIEVVRQAVDLGINFIDTANTYGGGLSEQFIGKAIKDVRDRVVLATKMSARVAEGPNLMGASRLQIMREVESSLSRLQTDYIDLYQMHYWDPKTPIEETLRALDDLVRQGKVRYIACSNYATWQVCEAVWTSRALRLESFVSVQFNWSMLNREIERELVPFCQAYNIGVLAYFPLAGGFLTGKYRRGAPPPAEVRFHSGGGRIQSLIAKYGNTITREHRESLLALTREQNLTEANFDLLERVEKFATERGHPVAELAIAWLLYNPIVSSVIAGASNFEQLAANAKAADWHLTAEEMEELDGTLSARGNGSVAGG